MTNQMEIIVNGFPETVPQGSTLAEVIRLLNEEHPDLIAEINGAFIHPQDYPATRLTPDDRLELINAAFGG